jgi:hypothetical protein
MHVDTEYPPIWGAVGVPANGSKTTGSDREEGFGDRLNQRADRAAI